MARAWPFSQDHPDLDPSAEDDFWLDDGLLHGVVTINSDVLVLHDLTAIDEAAQGARSGVGRRSMAGLRPLFRKIDASGVLHPLGGGNERDVKSMLFWVAMLREGLIDTMTLMNCGVEITADMLDGPIETSFGQVMFSGESYVFSPPAQRVR